MKTGPTNHSAVSGWSNMCAHVHEHEQTKCWGPVWLRFLAFLHPRQLYPLLYELSTKDSAQQMAAVLVQAYKHLELECVRAYQANALLGMSCCLCEHCDV